MTVNKLDVKSVAFAMGVLWGIAVFVVGAANFIWPGYGHAFLDGISSVYPGYDGLATFASILVGTGYAVLDGAIGGFLFAVLYNFCAGRQK